MPSETLTTTAVDLHARLELLLLERALATVGGLAADRDSMADLDDEIVATRHAYAGAAITEIATFRRQLHGRLQG